MKGVFHINFGTTLPKVLVSPQKSQTELLVAQRSFLREASLLWPGCRASFFVWLFLIGVEIIYFQGNIRLSFFVFFLSYERVID